MENNFTHLIYNIQFPVSSVPGVNGHMTVNTHQLAAHTEPVLNFSIKPNNTIETSIPQPRAVTAVAAPATLHLEQPHPVQHTQAVLLSHANMNTDTWLVAIVCPTQAMGYGLMVGMVRGQRDDQSRDQALRFKSSTKAYFPTYLKALV